MMKANIYNDQFLEWEKTITDEEIENGTCVRYSFVEGSHLEYYKDDPHGRPYVVEIGNCCDTFKSLKAAPWHLWDQWAQHNMEAES